MRNVYVGVVNSRYKIRRVVTCAFALTLPLLLAGCPSGTPAHVSALANATAPVVDGAAAAYSGANAIHAMRTDYDAIAAFDATSPVYNPRTLQPLLTDDQIKGRLEVLAAFQVYVQLLSAITGGTDSPQLQAAAKSAGSGLASVSNTVAGSVAGTTVPTTVTTVTTTPSGTTSSTTSSATAPTVISSTAQNGISVAIDALGQFLIYRKINQSLPNTVMAMDTNVKQLCDLLTGEIARLKSDEEIDYNWVINHQTEFLGTKEGKNIDPGVRRMMITKLPEMAREENASIAQLTQLSAAVLKLELTHHAFAAELQGNNPESIKQKLGDLEAAGQDLGKFYGSL